MVVDHQATFSTLEGVFERWMDGSLDRKQKQKLMDGPIGHWKDGWMVRSMEGWTNRPLNGWMEETIDCWSYLMDGPIGHRSDEWINQ